MSGRLWCGPDPHKLDVMSYEIYSLVPALILKLYRHPGRCLYEKRKARLNSVSVRERTRQKKRAMCQSPGHFNCDESRLTRGDKLPACGINGRLGTVQMVLPLTLTPNKTHVPGSRQSLLVPLLQHASSKCHLQL